MKIITFEEHFIHPATAAASLKALDGLSPHFRAAFNQGDAYSPSREQILDNGAGRIAAMDAHGIDIQVLSCNAPGTQTLAASEAVPMAKDANDVLAAAIQVYPDRFLGFATLPTPDPNAAALELERCVNQLGFKGAMINGRTGDRFLDDPSFEPILAAASALKVPIYLHPTIPAKSVQEAYYDGFDPMVSARFATAAWGWHMETGIHALRMILGGVFDRHPGLQLILGHWGEMIPFYLDRIDGVLNPVVKNLQRRVSEYFQEHVYVTPSGMFSLPPFMLTLQVMGADRILYAVDYPYVPQDGARAFLENAPICTADKHKIAHGNAERLLRL